MRKKILDQPIDILSMDEAAYLIKSALINPKQFKVITLNPEMIINALDNFEFQSALNNAELIVPDGTGIVWALKLKGYNNALRIPGIELAEKALASANELSKKVAIFGGKKDILEKAVNVLSNIYPRINFVKTIDGYQENEDVIAEEIAKENPNLILIALGTPKQEVWINKHSKKFPNSIIIGIGGSLDVWSGKKQRAPEWVRNLHLEWFYRVVNEPARLPRVLRSLPRFIYMILREKVNSL